MDKKYQEIAQFLEAVKADKYDVRLIHLDRAKYKPMTRQWTAAQVLECVPFLSAKNREGYNIYVRPVGYEFVLVDDVTRPFLAAAAALKPAALIETSPDNFQLWYVLPETPSNREQAKQICIHFAEILEGDKASAEPDHIGRLVGFTNRKPKYEKNGLYPFVKLHNSKVRYSTVTLDQFPANGVLVITENDKAAKIAQPRKGTTNDHSRSGQDFNLACMLVKKGFDDAYIYQRLEKKSDKAKEERHPEKYIRLTIANARAVVKG